MYMAVPTRLQDGVYAGYLPEEAQGPIESIFLFSRGSQRSDETQMKSPNFENPARYLHVQPGVRLPQCHAQP